MYLPLVLTVISVGFGAALTAWYYNRAFQSVHYEYLGLSGMVDDTYAALVRPLRLRRRLALCIAFAALGLAVALIALHTA